jgi:hypothetical protein
MSVGDKLAAALNVRKFTNLEVKHHGYCIQPVTDARCSFVQDFANETPVLLAPKSTGLLLGRHLELGWCHRSR